MSKHTRTLAVATAAMVILSAGAAGAGELIAAYKTTTGPTQRGVQFLDTNLAPAGDSFATPSLANGLAVGANSIFGAFGSDGSVRRYSVAGTPQVAFVGDPGYTPGPLAFGDGTLFQAYAFGSTFAVGAYAPDLDFDGGFFQVDSPVNGLAFGNDSLFVSFGDTLQRRDLHGALLESHSFNGIVENFNLGPLAFGDGKLFVGYARGSLGSSTLQHRIGFVDPDALGLTSSFNVGEQVRGLAYGDGQLFASYDFKLASYNAAGDQTNALVTALFGLGSQNGALAFLPTGSTCRVRPCEPPVRGGPVPEPATWALMILGFGTVGSALRASRRRKGALSAA